METLKLEHLVGYLSYGLKIQTKFGIDVPENGHIYRLIGICKKSTVFKFDDLVIEVAEKHNKGMSHEYFTFKPILHPLSSLTKEIEINGEKFVPIKELRRNFHGKIEVYMYLDGTITLDIETENYSQTVDLFDGYLITNQLLKWKFDIHGLIDKGLAIAVTGEFNPYK